MKQLTQEQLEQVYREHPEWLVEIEVGKWYKWVYDPNILFYVTKLFGANCANGYGWDKNGKWCDAGSANWVIDDFIPATQKEVEAALIAEARRRGFEDGVEIDNSDIGVHDIWRKIDGDELAWDGKRFEFVNQGAAIFHDGKWATVITPASTLTEDIQALKDKYPNYNWTIIAEAK